MKWFHIFFSLLTLLVILLAAIQAFFVLVQDYWLKRNPSHPLLTKCPPLLRVEKWLWKSLTIGFTLLTILFLSSIYSFRPMLWVNALVIKKTIFVLLGWVCFAVLLFGRQRWGWRGRQLTYPTFTVAMGLLVVYFVSL